VFVAAVNDEARPAYPLPVVQPLTSPFRIGDVEIANRVLLAPLAGIGNWFVRLQARRHGAGMAVSEMVSSFGLHYRNERTLEELLRLHPDEHPVSVQLFGQDPDVMRSAAGTVAEAGADLIDINMGCPVRKVCKTGAGAALLADPDLAVAIASAAREGGGLPVTVKLRSGLAPGGREGLELALRLAEEVGVAAIAFHPRSAATQHKGEPDYALARELTELIDVPMIISGGLDSAEDALHAYEASGADAVMIARGSLGNPWIFEQLTGRRTALPERDEVIAELLWVIDRAEEHLGPDRAARYLRKFYPWYLERLGADTATAGAFQVSEDLGEARRLVRALEVPTEAVAA
jgi:tRNA-dihydrouridine synthase B